MFALLKQINNHHVDVNNGNSKFVKNLVEVSSLFNVNHYDLYDNIRCQLSKLQQCLVENRKIDHDISSMFLAGVDQLFDSENIDTKYNQDSLSQLAKLYDQPISYGSAPVVNAGSNSTDVVEKYQLLLQQYEKTRDSSLLKQIQRLEQMINDNMFDFDKNQTTKNPFTAAAIPAVM